MSTLTATTLAQLLDAVAAKTPTPGGGAVACTTGALGAALAQMVVNYSVAKRSLERHRPELENALRTLGRARDVLIELAEEDAAAYAKVNELQRLPESDPRRREQWPVAVQVAVQVPLSAAAACCDLLRLFEGLAPITNTMLRSDLAIAAILAEASARAAWWNVEVNLPLLSDEAERQRVIGPATEMLREAALRRARIESACTQPAA